MLGSHENQRFRKNYLGYSSNTFAFAVGADANLPQAAFKPGMMVMVSNTSSKEKATPSTAKVKAVALSVHGTCSPEKTYYVEGSIGAGRIGFEGARFDTTNSVYTSTYKGAAVNSALGAGYDENVTKTITLTPFVISQGSSTTMDAYTEKGGPSPFRMPSNLIKSFLAGGGVRCKGSLMFDSQVKLQPFAGLTYLRDFNARARTINATLVGTPTPLKSSPNAKDRYEIALEVEGASGVSAALSYTGNFKASYAAHGVGLSWPTSFK